MRRVGSGPVAVLSALGLAGPAPAMAAALPAVQPVTLEAEPPGPLATAAFVMRLFDARDAEAIAGMYVLPSGMTRADIAELFRTEFAGARSSLRVRPVRVLVDDDLAVVLLWRHHDHESLDRTLESARLSLRQQTMQRGEDGIWRMLPPRSRLDAPLLGAAAMERLDALIAAAEDAEGETEEALLASRRGPTATFLRTVLPASDALPEVLGRGWSVRPTMIVGDTARPSPDDTGVPPGPVLEAMVAQDILGIAKATYTLPGRVDSRGREVVATVTCLETADAAARTVERYRWRRLSDHDSWGVPWDRLDVDVLADEDAAHWHAHVERWIIEVQVSGDAIDEADRDAGWSLTEEILRRLTTGPSTRIGEELEDEVALAAPAAAAAAEDEEPDEPPTAPRPPVIDEDPILVTEMTSLLPDADEAAAATGVRWARRLRLLVSTDDLEPEAGERIPPAARRLLEEPGARRLVHVTYVDRDRPERRIATVLVAFDRMADAGAAYPKAFASDPTRPLVSPETDRRDDGGRLYAVLGRYTIDSRRLGDWRGPELARLQEVILRRAMARLEGESARD